MRRAGTAYAVDRAIVNVPESRSLVLDAREINRIGRQLMHIEPSPSLLINGIVNALLFQILAALVIILVRIVL